MVYDSKALIKKFIAVLSTQFHSIFGFIHSLNIPAYFNTVIETISLPPKFNQTLTNGTSDFPVFTQEDVPTYFNPSGTTIEEDISHAFHKASIAILGFLCLMVRIQMVDQYSCNIAIIIIIIRYTISCYVI